MRLTSGKELNAHSHISIIRLPSRICTYILPNHCQKILVNIQTCGLVDWNELEPLHVFAFQGSSHANAVFNILDVDGRATEIYQFQSYIIGVREMHENMQLRLPFPLKFFFG